jgi:hypothetical protein
MSLESAVRATVAQPTLATARTRLSKRDDRPGAAKALRAWLIENADERDLVRRRKAGLERRNPRQRFLDALGPGLLVGVAVDLGGNQGEQSAEAGAVGHASGAAGEPPRDLAQGGHAAVARVGTGERPCAGLGDDARPVPLEPLERPLKPGSAAAAGLTARSNAA